MHIQIIKKGIQYKSDDVIASLPNDHTAKTVRQIFKNRISSELQ